MASVSVSKISSDSFGSSMASVSVSTISSDSKISSDPSAFSVSVTASVWRISSVSVIRSCSSGSSNPSVSVSAVASVPVVDSESSGSVTPPVSTVSSIRDSLSCSVPPTGSIAKSSQATSKSIHSMILMQSSNRLFHLNIRTLLLLNF